MAKVQKTVITALGEQMLFSSALTYTDATLCSQDVSNLTTDQLRALTDLTGKVLSSPISAHKRQGNTKADQVDVQVTFTNRDQKTDINYSSIGWFARDRQGHETLIAVTPFFGTDTIAAAPPDGTATSSKNITLSMAVGTATEINVLIDPAGSVTPSTFNAEIDKINKALALKADNAELADYAKTADVQAKLDTKANTTDLAPFAKSTDVDKQIENVNNAVTNATNTEQANIDKISKALATKRDITDSYSKDELDKKFLQLSTDTGGKVDANQVATMIENKADKSDVNTALRGKANVGDVTVLQAKLDTKANTTDLAPFAKSTDVDKQIENVNNAVTNATNTEQANIDKISKALATKRDITDSYSKDELDKKFLQLSTDTGGKVDANQVATMIENKADKSDVNTALRGKANVGDVTVLQAKLDTKANTTDLAPFAKSTDVDKQIENVNNAVTNATNTEQANIDKISKALATKRDITDSYSKDELDKKFLQLSTDTGGKVDANQVATMIENKADKSDVNTALRGKANVGDVTVLQAKLDTKANTTDLAPFAKSTDVDKQIENVNNAVTNATNTEQANIDKISKALATKRDITDSYSKDELDKKFLQLSTDTGGKVDANQVATMIENKADKSDVNTALRGKANVGDVTVLQAKLDTKANTTDLAPFAKSTDVDKQIENVNNAVTNATNTEQANIDKISKALATKRDITDSYSKDELDKKFLQLSTDTGGKVDANQVATMIENKADKSDVNTALRGKANVGDVTVLQAKLDTKANTTDLAPFAKSTDVDKQIENVNNAVTNATNTEQANIDKISKALATKRDITDSYSKDELDKKFLQLSTDTGGKVDANQVATMIENKADKSDVNTALRGKANVGDVTVLQGKVNVSTPLFREISDDSTWEDIFGVTNPTNVLTSLRINPGGNGQLVNDYAAGIGFGGNDTKAVISVDYDSHVARFTAGNGISPGWSEDVAWKSDISSLTQALTKLQAAFDAQQTKIAALQATVNNQADQLTYFKQHYIEVEAFDADQIKQAMAWTGDDGQKLAIIRDKENEGGK